jgi:hypothetical protein
MNKHLSPLALLFFLKDQVSSKIGLLPAILVVCDYLNFLKGQYFIQISCFVVLVLLAAFVEYFSFTYEFLDNELVIRSGLFKKKEKHIPYSRIQTIHTNHPFWIEPLKLTKVILETANQDDDGIVVLRVISQAELERLQATMQVAESAVEDEVKGYLINSRDLAIYTLTSPGIIAGIVLVLGFYGKLSDFNIKIDFSWPLLLLVLLVGIVLSFLATWQRYYNFNIYNEQNQLKAKSGLFTKTQMTLPVKRIQGIIFEATYFRFLTKLVSIQAIASSKVTGEEEGNINLIPVVEAKYAADALHELLPTWPSVIKKLIPLAKSGKRALFVYRFNCWFWISLVVNLLAYLYLGQAFIWVAILSLVIGLYILFTSIIIGKTSGVSFDDKYLYLGTKRYFKIIKAILPRDKIQYLKLSQSVWMKRKKLMHIELEVMDKNYGYQIRVRYLPEQVAKNVQKWLWKNK